MWFFHQMESVSGEKVKTFNGYLKKCQKFSIFAERRVFDVWMLRWDYRCMEGVEWRSKSHTYRTFFTGVNLSIFSERRVFGVWIWGWHYCSLEVFLLNLFYYFMNYLFFIFFLDNFICCVSL